MRAVLVAVLLLALAPAAEARKRVGAVPPGHTLVVVGQSGAERADAFEAGTGRAPAGAMWYLPIYEDPTAILADIEAAVAARPGLVVNLGISFGAASTPSPPYTGAVAAGAFDAHIAALARTLRRLETVAYLRPGYEFDLLGGQYGPPPVYKAAYRHVVDELRARRVRNAAYVWHSAGAFWRAADPSLFAVSSGTLATAVDDAAPGADALPIRAFVPGRRYVDAFGISYWQDSCCFGRSQPAARAEYEERTRELLAQARAMRLPLHVSEATPAYVGADSGDESTAWLDATFDLVEAYDIAQLDLISIDWREGGFFAAPFWNGYWPDARIHHHAATRARFLERTASERYWFRSADLPEALGFRG